MNKSNKTELGLGESREPLPGKYWEGTRIPKSTRVCDPIQPVPSVPAEIESTEPKEPS